MLIFYCPADAGVSLNSAKIPALDAGYHPVSLLHLHSAWNVLSNERKILVIAARRENFAERKNSDLGALHIS